MRKIIVLTGILLILGALNAPALTITNLTVTGATNDSGNIIVSANVSSAAYLLFDASTTNGFGKRYFSPTAAVGGSWSNTTWDPYIIGDFVVNVTAYGQDGSNATASTTVTVTRVTYGTINSIKYSSLPYNANGAWSNVDTTQVKLNDLGAVSDDTGVGTLKCNLLNATVTPTPGTSAEARDMAYCDTSEYKPAGTPYRFELNLHARPRNYMGMGEIKRWIWSPDDTNNPTGRGTLTVDLTSTSPWRSTYSNALQSHVGFNCKFAPTNSDMPTGTIMCTSAHYQDVRPTNATSGTASRMRIGMYVNGHTGTNSYLKSFLSDDFLHQQYQITNTQQATNLLAGFIQHFDTNDAPIDSLTAVTTQLTRVEGGTNLVYDYNYDGVGDAGYELMFYFEFHSAVAAQFGVSTNEISGDVPLPPDTVSATKGTYQDKVCVTWTAAANATGYTVWRSRTNNTNTAALAMSGITTTNYNDTSAVVGLLYYYWVKATNTSGTSTFSSSDSGWRSGRADPAIVSASGGWYVWFSGSGYQMGGPWSLGVSGTPVAADFDGDGYTDPAIVDQATGAWNVWFSSLGYQMGGPYSLGGSGTPLAADFDGDRYSDPAMQNAGNWYIWYTSLGYQLGGPYSLGGSGTPVAADFDGDGYADPAMVDNAGAWCIWFTSAGYQMGGPYSLGGSGTPVAADFDADGYADPAMVDNAGAWCVWYTSLGYQMGGPYSLGVSGTPLAADFDGQ